MLRKIILSVLLFISIASRSDAVVKQEKYTGPLLKGCSIYQLGENEIIVKLSGRDIPLPEVKKENDSLIITLTDAKVYHPEKIVKTLDATIETIPLIYSVRVENISQDNEFSARLTINSNLSMKVSSVLRSLNGYSLRLKSDVQEERIAYLPEPKAAISPLTTLPFRVDSRITLELRDAELRDVLRGIMSYIGRNIIIDPSFPDTVLITMTLNDVRADEVLNYLMRTYDLACYKSGVNTLTFGTLEGLYKLSGARELKSFKLHFAEAGQVSTMLKAIAGLEDNAITVDERMKTLYVRTNPAKMAEVEEAVNLLDSPQKQVMIHATIFEFNDNDALTVQNALNIAYDDIQLSLGGVGGLNVKYRADRTLKGTREVWTSRVITDTFEALQASTKGKVLANPSVIATDGKPSEITLTQDFPYVSDRDNEKGTVTWSTEEVGPKLKFTPRIGRDGYVTLTLDISTGDVIGTQTSSTGEQMPITTTRSVKTEVRVRDGMPFVIGGLFREDQHKSVTKIPVLGDIPILGELFSYKYDATEKTQVVMVIIPYILDAN